MSKLPLFLALTASLGAASMASASDFNYFDATSTAPTEQTINVGYVNASGDGIVEVYAFDGGVQGQLMGTEAVTAGANQNVSVDIGSPYANKVLVVLDVAGQEVAQKVVNLTDL